MNIDDLQALISRKYASRWVKWINNYPSVGSYFDAGGTAIILSEIIHNDDQPLMGYVFSHDYRQFLVKGQNSSYGDRDFDYFDFIEVRSEEVTQRVWKTMDGKIVNVFDGRPTKPESSYDDSW